MAETPEDVARGLCPLNSHPTSTWAPSTGCHCKAIASALRAQYVAGLDAALVACVRISAGGTRYNIKLECIRAIRELAEQAKRDPGSGGMA